MEEITSKIILDEKRLKLASDHVDRVLTEIFISVGFPEDISKATSSHLVDANLVGVESHGIMRVLEYADEVKSGVLNPSSRPELIKQEKNFLEINASGGIGIPAGKTGPVVLDFATSKIAGGWVYAAKSAGALLPDNSVKDANGNVTRNPDDYFSGGALMPAAEHKGFGLALIAELVGQALLGPSTTKHWLLIAIKADQFREKTAFERVADEILNEIRSCPPAPGSSGVQIPGERERIQRRASQNILQIPVSTWDQICDLAGKHGVPI